MVTRAVDALTRCIGVLTPAFDAFTATARRLLTWACVTTKIDEVALEAMTAQSEETVSAALTAVEQAYHW
jgi:hypothetical protein